MAPSPTNFLDVIKQVALDPNVDVQKMHGLLDIQERMMNKQAEMNFTAALTALQSELPRITQDAEIRHNNKLIARYAKYETIDTAIRPLLIQNGFSLRYNTRKDGDKVIVTATLSHKDGHSITDEIPLSIDASGAKNSVQGVGSTISYGKRYLVGMLLNLVFEGEDDGGLLGRGRTRERHRHEQAGRRGPGAGGGEDAEQHQGKDQRVDPADVGGEA